MLWKLAFGCTVLHKSHTGDHKQQTPNATAILQMHTLQRRTSGSTNLDTSYTPPPSRSHCAVKYSTFCSGLGGLEVSLTSPIWLAHFRVYGGPSVCCACCAAASSSPEVEASCAAVCVTSTGCLDLSKHDSSKKFQHRATVAMQIYLHAQQCD